MSQNDWDWAPKNTNGVERVNGLSKSSGNSPLPLYMAMQSLYEKDKVFAVQQLVAKEGSKISYRDTSEEPKLLPELKLERKNILCLTETRSMDHQTRLSISVKMMISAHFQKQKQCIKSPERARNE